MKYLSALEQYVSIEREAHIYNSSSIVNKVTQEVLEMRKSKRMNEVDNVTEESRDAIVNILSAMHKTGVLPNEKLVQKTLQVSDEQLEDALMIWNEHIQGFNQDYSRKHITPENLKNTTEWLISSILSYANSQEDLENILAYNTAKFASRVDKYAPVIDLKAIITNHPNFPDPGIQFKDVSPLLRSPKVMDYITGEFMKRTYNADIIVGLDARGFLFGMMVANRLGKPFVMVRKKGKLPGDIVAQSYAKEYSPEDEVGTDGKVSKPNANVIEIQKGSIQPGQKVAIIDDLLATGGTMNAAAKLVEQIGGEVIGLFNVIQLDDPYLVQQRKNHNLERYNIQSLVSYDD